MMIKETKTNLPIDEALYEQGYNQAIKYLDNFDWQAFRREAAKDILASFASNSVVIDDRPDAFDSDFYSKIAVEWADSLIKQLKKKDERPTP